MALTFRIIASCYQKPNRNTKEQADFLLEQNNWDDYGYRTTYCLHASSKMTGKEPEYLGSLRIMKKGQNTKEINLLSKILKSKPFENLPNDFISLSFDLDLFIGLQKYLKKDIQKKQFIESLHLILGEDSEYFTSELKDDDCFNKSLLRDGSDLGNMALLKAREILLTEGVLFDLRKTSIEVSFSHVNKPIKLSFNPIKDYDDSLLPNGALIFIGKNGSGKSTAIYKLAKIMYTDPTKRHFLNETVGTISPNNVGVSKLFLISYSPFDNFVLPFTGEIGDNSAKSLLSRDINYRRLIYCGIRDIEKETDDLQESIKGEFHLRQDRICLKDVSMLASEFWEALNAIYDDNRKKLIWKKFLESAQIYQRSFYDCVSCLDKDCLQLWDDEVIKNNFTSQSTGHKYFLHSYASVLAYIDNNCLLLFDEPENHLHPPLLSFMMTEFRKLLSEYRSVMFVATHSPVILQETFSSNVFIVRNDGDKSNVSHPRIETYGASISAITSEVFDLTTDMTKYHDAIKYLYDNLDVNNCSNAKEMLDTFKSKLNIQYLSGQAESYLINLFANK